jgi:hypothetical protein
MGAARETAGVSKSIAPRHALCDLSDGGFLSTNTHTSIEIDSS